MSSGSSHPEFGFGQLTNSGLCLRSQTIEVECRGTTEVGSQRTSQASTALSAGIIYETKQGGDIRYLYTTVADLQNQSKQSKEVN